MWAVLGGFLGKQITDKNWLPFILVGVIAWLWWNDAQRRDAALEQAYADHAHALAVVNSDVMLIKQNQDRAMRVAQISKQPEGKYAMVIAGDSTK